MLKVVKKLLGIKPEQKPDPTTDWPLSDTATPEVDCAQQTVGDLHFGDSLESARSLGRPDVFEWADKRCDYCMLTYARAGFRIDFDADRLNYVVFFLDRDEFLPDTNPPVVFSTPCIDSMTLSKETTLKQVAEHFGIPKECDDGSEDNSDEIILYYSIGQLTVEFEAYQSGFLKRINIYQDKSQNNS